MPNDAAGRQQGSPESAPHDADPASWATWEEGDVPTRPLAGATTESLAAVDCAAEPKMRRRVSRRTVLASAAAGAVALGAGAGLGAWYTHRVGSTAPASATQQLAHLLRRAGFGMRPSEAAAYASLGYGRAVERLLNPSSVASNLDSQLANLNLDVSTLAGLQRWFLLRMIYSPRPLEEKMTLFWHGMLTSSAQKIGGKKGYPLLVQQNNLLRSHALGRFDDLIRAVSTDPAMMYWLDLRTSTAKAPNENYARELMELFTLGIGNYSQSDVVAGARALSGWVVREAAGVFVPARHDDGTKTYLGQTGNFGLDDVVRIVCAHPATAHHLAWRLWTFFAYENPSDADLQPLVDAYVSQQHSITAVMRALLMSPGFVSERAYRSRLKSPTEFVVGAARALEVTTTGEGLPQLLTQMGQTLFAPPNVSGWDGDKTSASWLSTESWMTRINFVNQLLALALGDEAGVATSLSAPITTRQIRTPQALVGYHVEMLLDNQLNADRASAVNDFLAASGHDTSGGPSLALYGGASVPVSAVRGALYLLMGMPEYQLN